MGRNRRRRNQRRRRDAREEQEQEPPASGWRQTIESLGGFTVVSTLGAAAIAVVVLVILNLPGNQDPNDEPYVPIERGTVSAHIEGDPAAPVRIVEFSDFQCPFCERFARETAPLLREEYVETGQASIEYRPVAILGPESVAAAAAAECALDQGRFWDYHDLLFLRQNGENRGTFADDHLKDFARELAAAFPDFDVEAFDRCLDSGQKEQGILDQTSQATDLGIQSTPSFFVNGQLITGAQPVDVFRQLIDAELAE